MRSEFVERTLQETGGDGVDTVFDIVGGETRSRSLDVLRPLGQLVILGNASAEQGVMLSTNDLWISNKTVSGFVLGGYSEIYPTKVGEAAKEALAMVARGEIHTEIFGVYPWEKAAETHLLLEQKNTVGKLILKVQ